MSDGDTFSASVSDEGSTDYTQSFRFQFFVPLFYNKNADDTRDEVPASKFARLHDTLTRRFGGLNYQRARPPLVTGLWSGNRSGEPITDECYLYDIIVEPSDEHREYFRELVSQFLQDRESPLGLDQEAVLLVFSRVETLYLMR